MHGPNAEDIRIVVFDLGGVIVHNVDSWEMAIERAECQPDPFSQDEVFRSEWSRLASELRIGAISPRTYYEGVSRASAGQYSPADVIRIHSSFMIDQYPGVSELIDELHGIGVETGALSDTNAPHWHDLMNSERFSTVRKLRRPHASHLLGYAKPDAEIYREFERKTGYYGSDILFVDDRPGNVAGAQKLGWHADLIDPGENNAAQLRECFIEHGILES